MEDAKKKSTGSSSRKCSSLKETLKRKLAKISCRKKAAAAKKSSRRCKNKRKLQTSKNA
jgi:hypothetical protein